MGCPATSGSLLNTMKPLILNAAEDADQWHEVLKQCPLAMQDIYYYPEYVQMYCSISGSEGILFVYTDAGQIWLNAVVRSPVAEGCYDIETPYGYGGPSTSTTDAAFLTTARNAYNVWLNETGVIAELTRFHPLLNNGEVDDPKTETSFNRHTVSIDLRNPPAFSGRALNSVKRARNGGVEVKVLSAIEYMDHFKQLYEENMRAVNADNFYFFDDAHYRSLARVVENDGMLLVAMLEGEWLAASLFLRGTTWLHYHLAAANFKARIPGSQNLLIHTAAEMGHEAGLERLHLGGGRTTATDDSLYFFKQAMSTDQHNFYVGRRVVDQGRYDRVVENWRKDHPALVEKYGNLLRAYRKTN